MGDNGYWADGTRARVLIKVWITNGRLCKVRARGLQLWELIDPGSSVEELDMRVRVEERLKGHATTLPTGNIDRDGIGVNTLVTNYFPLVATVNTSTKVSSASLNFRFDLFLNSRSFKAPKCENRRAEAGTSLRA